MTLVPISVFSILRLRRRAAVTTHTAGNYGGGGLGLKGLIL